MAFYTKVLGAALAVAALAGPAWADVKVGDPAPSFGGSWRNHDNTTLADLRGRVILVDFWRTW